MRLLVDPDEFSGRAVAFEDAGRADGVVESLQFLQRLHSVGVGKRVASRNQISSVIGSISCGQRRRSGRHCVLLDGERLHRRSRVPRDAARAGAAVLAMGRWETARARTQIERIDRVVRRSRVKLLPGRPALLREDRVHRNNTADRRSAWSRSIGRVSVTRGSRSGSGCRGQNGRARATERCSQPLAVDVPMDVGDAGNDGLALEVDDARGRAGVRRHRRRRTDREDAFADTAIASVMLDFASTVMTLPFRSTRSAEGDRTRGFACVYVAAPVATAALTAPLLTGTAAVASSVLPWSRSPHDRTGSTSILTMRDVSHTPARCRGNLRP